MKYLMLPYIAYKNLSGRKIQTFFNIVLISMPLILFILSMSLMDSVNRFIEAEIINNVLYRTLNINYSDTILSKDEVLNEVKKINYIIDAYPQAGVFGGDIINVSKDLSRDNEGKFKNIGIQACGAYNTPKVISGRSFNKDESNVGLIPEKFYPNNDFDISWSKEKINFINGKDLIGESITITYNAYDHCDAAKQPKISKTFNYTFKIIGIYDAVKIGIEPYYVFIPYSDVASMQENVKRYTAGVSETVGFNITAVVDKQNNVQKAISSLKSMGYDAYAIYQISGNIDMIYFIMMIGIIIGILILILAFIVISTTTVHSVKKRTRDIGILKAVGYTNKKITLIILFEMLLVSIISIVVILFTCLILLYLWHYLFKNNLTMYLRNFNLSINNISIILSVMMGSIIPILGGLAAICHASEIPPTEALKQ